MKTFTGIPLECRILGEGFVDEIRTFYRSAAPAPCVSVRDRLVWVTVYFVTENVISISEKFSVLSEQLGRDQAV